MLLRDYGSHQGPGGPGGPDTFSAVVRFAFVAGLLTLGITSFTLFHHPPTGAFRSIQDHIPLRKPPPDFEVVQTLAEYNDLVAKIPDPDRHPIDRLIADALDKQASLLAQQSHNVDDAARKYRERRGRHPPPGFDAWMKYAVNHDAVVVESFFDRIYHDLAPFWALPPNITATRAESWHHVVRVRNGVARGVGDTTGLVAWLDLWTSLVAEAAPYLPDVDMPINYMDESRLLVPWETIAGYVATERRTRQLTPAADTLQHYTGLAAVDALGGGNGSRPYDPEWISAHSPRYWDLARVTCPPNSPSRHVRALSDFSRPASLPSDWRPPFAFEGYVQNFSAAADPCTQPHLRGLHGTFVEPLSMSSAAELIPLFGGSKLTMNNEILIPGAMYLTDDPFYSGGAGHGPPWAFKNRTVVWRGAASGGRNKKENWTRFQRHRLLEMLNATTVSRLEAREAKGRSKGRGKGKGKDAPARTFDMAPVALYDYPRRRNGTVGELLRSVSDTGFTDLLCFPAGECGYIQPHFHAVPGMPMAAQYGDKFIPDADGNSFSARFRGLLLSTSLPLKATIYAEWHDDRLQPWLHFAPLDNTFQDLHAVLDFFLDGARGDAAAHLLAASGKRWAEQVLRRDDMLLYVWRLLLEFARVCDENRHRLGYVDDLPAAQQHPRSLLGRVFKPCENVCLAVPLYPRPVHPLVGGPAAANNFFSLALLRHPFGVSFLGPPSHHFSDDDHPFFSFLFFSSTVDRRILLQWRSSTTTRSPTTISARIGSAACGRTLTRPARSTAAASPARPRPPPSPRGPSTACGRLSAARRSSTTAKSGPAAASLSLSSRPPASPACSRRPLASPSTTAAATCPRRPSPSTSPASRPTAPACSSSPRRAPSRPSRPAPPPPASPPPCPSRPPLPASPRSPLATCPRPTRRAPSARCAWRGPKPSTSASARSGPRTRPRPRRTRNKRVVSCPFQKDKGRQGRRCCEGYLVLAAFAVGDQNTYGPSGPGFFLLLRARQGEKRKTHCNTREEKRKKFQKLVTTRMVGNDSSYGEHGQGKPTWTVALC